MDSKEEKAQTNEGVENTQDTAKTETKMPYEVAYCPSKILEFTSLNL